MGDLCCTTYGKALANSTRIHKYTLRCLCFLYRFASFALAASYISCSFLFFPDSLIRMSFFLFFLLLSNLSYHFLVGYLFSFFLLQHGLIKYLALLVAADLGCWCLHLLQLPCPGAEYSHLVSALLMSLSLHHTLSSISFNYCLICQFLTLPLPQCLCPLFLLHSLMIWTIFI